jgi:hypothetical protein
MLENEVAEFVKTVFRDKYLAEDAERVLVDLLKAVVEQGGEYLLTPSSGIVACKIEGHPFWIEREEARPLEKEVAFSLIFAYGQEIFILFDQLNEFFIEDRHDFDEDDFDEDDLDEDDLE